MAGKPIQLSDGQTLLAITQSVQKRGPAEARHSGRVEPVLRAGAAHRLNQDALRQQWKGSADEVQ